MNKLQDMKTSAGSLLIASVWTVVSLPLSIILLFIGQTILTNGNDWCELSYRNPAASEVLAQFRDANFAQANSFLNITSAVLLISTIAILTFLLAKTHRSTRSLTFSLMLFPIIIYSLLWLYSYSSGLFCQY